jgi:hypothetical protein
MPSYQVQNRKRSLLFQETQSDADDFAGVAVTPRGNLAFDEAVKMSSQVDVARWNDRLLSLEFYRDWQFIANVY